MRDRDRGAARRLHAVDPRIGASRVDRGRQAGPGDDRVGVDEPGGESGLRREIVAQRHELMAERGERLHADQPGGEPCRPRRRHQRPHRARLVQTPRHVVELEERARRGPLRGEAQQERVRLITLAAHGAHQLDEAPLGEVVAVEAGEPGGQGGVGEQLRPFERGAHADEW